MYKIIEFDEEERSTEIVPTSWCFSKDGVTFAFWPPWQDKGKIIKAIALRCPYNPQWESYKIARVFVEANTYKMAIEKLEIANDTSGVEEEFEKRSNKFLRSLRHKKRILSSSGDSDDDESSTLKQIKLDDFPEPPKVHEDNSSMTVSTKIIEKVDESIMVYPDKDNLANKTAKKEKIADYQVTISSTSQSIPQALVDNKDSSGNIKSSPAPNEFPYAEKIDEYRRTDSTLLPSPQALVENNKNSSETTKSSSTPNKFQYTENAPANEKAQLKVSTDNERDFEDEDLNGNGNGIPITRTPKSSEIKVSTMQIQHVPKVRNRSNLNAVTGSPDNLASIQDEVNNGNGIPINQSPKSNAIKQKQHEPKMRHRSNLNAVTGSHNNLASTESVVNDDEGNDQSKKTSSYVLTKDDLLALNDDNRFLHISGMMQRIIKGQAELKVLIQTNKSGGSKNSNDGNDYAEIMLTGKLFPFNEYETFKRFNEDRLAKDKQLVEKVTKYLNTLGGNDDDDSFVRACLKTILTDQLANQFNLMGRNNKNSFKQLPIYKIIVEAAFVSCNGYKEKNTYESTGLWLKQSKKRIQDKEEREARAANKD